MKNLLICIALGIIAVLFFQCSSEPEIEMNDTVKIRYHATLEDGTFIDSTRNDSLLTVTVGEGNIFPVIETNLIGLKAGDTATIMLKPGDAFGPRRPEMIGMVPRSALPDTIDLEVGMSWQVPSPDGIIYGTILELTEDSIKIDSNHPLSGETLQYYLEVVEVTKAP